HGYTCRLYPHHHKPLVIATLVVYTYIVVARAAEMVVKPLHRNGTEKRRDIPPTPRGSGCPSTGLDRVSFAVRVSQCSHLHPTRAQSATTPTLDVVHHAPTSNTLVRHGAGWLPWRCSWL